MSRATLETAAGTSVKSHSIAWAVNYGVNLSHRAMNAQLFATYAEANTFYGEIDRSVWKSGEILRLGFDEAGYVNHKSRKKSFTAHGDCAMTPYDRNLPLHKL